MKCLERRKKRIEETVKSLERDISLAEEDQRKHEGLIAKHRALRKALRAELMELVQKVDECRQSHESFTAQAWS